MRLKIAFWTGLSVICLYLSFQKHEHAGIYNYHTELWADRAGYYVYLPMLFKYGTDSRNFPDSIAEKTGLGFSTDKIKGKIYTKYSYGVAFFEAPFFLAADGLAALTGQERNGFSAIYHRFIGVSGVFYLVLGLFFLAGFLKTYYPEVQVYATIVLLFSGSHLFYYGLYEAGMSHVYSFFLFSCCLWFCDRCRFLLQGSGWHYFFLGLLAGFIILVRPTNLLFLLFMLVVHAESGKEIRERGQRILFTKNSLLLYAGLLLVFLPQMVYWFILTGDFLLYSYENEEFYWLSPKTHLTWFAARNGLFVTTPLFLFVLYGCWLMIKKGMRTGWYLLVLFLGFSYLVSCWWCWSFGCSFGARNFVEYLAVFSIPLCFLLQRPCRVKTRAFLFFGIGLLLIFVNLKRSYYFDGCFYGDDWDWGHYFSLLLQ